MSSAISSANFTHARAKMSGRVARSSIRARALSAASSATGTSRPSQRWWDKVRCQSAYACALLLAGEMHESAHETYARWCPTSALKRLSHRGFSRRVIEGDLFTFFDRAYRIERTTLHARIWFARVIQKSPRMTRSHRFSLLTAFKVLSAY